MFKCVILVHVDGLTNFVGTEEEACTEAEEAAGRIGWPPFNWYFYSSPCSTICISSTSTAPRQNAVSRRESYETNSTLKLQCVAGSHPPDQDTIPAAPESFQTPRVPDSYLLEMPLTPAPNKNRYWSGDVHCPAGFSPYRVPPAVAQQPGLPYPISPMNGSRRNSHYDNVESAPLSYTTVWNFKTWLIRQKEIHAVCFMRAGLEEQLYLNVEISLKRKCRSMLTS